MSHLLLLRKYASDPGLLKETEGNAGGLRRPLSPSALASIGAVGAQHSPWDLDDLSFALDRHRADVRPPKVKPALALRPTASRAAAPPHQSLGCLQNGIEQRMRRSDWKAGWYGHGVFGLEAEKPLNLALERTQPAETKENGWHTAPSPLRLFETKTRDQMAPKELMYSERLERTLSERRALHAREILLATTGKTKKEALDAYALANEGKPPWIANGDRVAGVFSEYEPDPPGCAVRGSYAAVTQPARTMNLQRNFICGDGDQKFWKPPPAGSRAGTSKALREAEALLLPKGVRKLRKEERATLRRERATLRREQGLSQSSPAIETDATLKLSMQQLSVAF